MKKRLKGLATVWLAIIFVFTLALPVYAATGDTVYLYKGTEALSPGDYFESTDVTPFEYDGTKTIDEQVSAAADPDRIGWKIWSANMDSGFARSISVLKKTNETLTETEYNAIVGTGDDVLVEPISVTLRLTAGLRKSTLQISNDGAFIRIDLDADAGYALPPYIFVFSGDLLLSQGDGCTYDPSTGEIAISTDHPTGDIVVIASAELALENVLAQLENHLTQDGGAINEINDDIASITALIGSLGNGNTVKSEIDRLGGLIEALTANINANASGISANAGEIADLKNSLAGLGDALTAIGSDSLADALRDLDGALDTLQSQVNTNTNRIDQLRDDVDALNLLIAGKADAATIAAEFDRINDLINSLDGTYATDSALTSALASAEALAKAYADTGDEALRALLTAELANINSRLTAQDAEITSVRASITALENAVEGLKSLDFSDAKAFEDAIKKLNAAIDGAKEQAASADTALKNELTAKIETADKALEDKIGEVQANLEQSVRKLQNSNTAQTVAVIFALEQLDDAIELAKATALAGDDALSAEIEEATAALAASVEAVRKDLEKMQAALNQTIKDGDTALAKSIADVKAALEAADAADRAEFKKEYEDLEKAVEALQEELDTAMSAIDAMDELLEAKGNFLTEKTEELEEKDRQLRTFVTVVCVMSAVSLCGSGAFVTWFFLKGKKRI